MSVLHSFLYAIALFVVGVAIAIAVEAAASRRNRSWSQKIRHSIHALWQQLLAPEPGHRRVDRVLFYAAAAVALSAVTVSLVFVPITRATLGFAGPQLESAVFFFLVVLDFMTVALFMLGWGANHPAGTAGAFRAAAQLVSYVVPLGFAVTGAVMAGQSLQAVEIVNHQRIWYGIWQPLGLTIYIAAVFGQTYRPPANLPFSDGSNVLIEHHGAGAAVLRLGLYAIWFEAAAMGAVLFLGGARGPWLPGPVWFLAKTGFLLGIMAWLGTRYSTLKEEQILRGAWLMLIPASILNVVLVGALLMVAR